MALQISRILHAGYLFKNGEDQIAFDPIFETVFSGNCHSFPKVEFDIQKIRELKLSAVFISHYHDDHCSLESLNYLDRETPIYMYCLFDEMFSMIRELGFKNVHSLRLRETVKIGSFEIMAIEALDADVDSLFHIRCENLNILNVVDSWIAPETFKKLAKSPWDLILWPFQTMRELEVISPRGHVNALPEIPVEWKEQLLELKPRYLIPSSCQFQMEQWSWYNQVFFPISYQFFNQEIKSLLPETEIIRLDPSQSIILSENSWKKNEPLSWVSMLDETLVDYQFNPEFKQPSTASIALKFSPLTSHQKEVILEFCRRDLLERYRSLPEPLDEYFEKPRVWKLSLYDHHGLAEDFYYEIDGSQIKSTEIAQPGWVTEIPAVKLYSALQEGEAMTSLYLRVNDIDYPADIETEMRQADPLEDPLIRCLFSGIFGAYQSAQLKSLKERKDLSFSNNKK